MQETSTERVTEQVKVKVGKGDPPETDGDRALRIRAKLGRSPHKVTKAEKEWLEDYEAAQEYERERQAAIYKLTEAADKYGRKQLNVIKREASTRVGRFSKEEAALLAKSRQEWEEKLDAARKCNREEMQRLQEAHQKELSSIEEASDVDLTQIHDRFKCQYEEAEGELKARSQQLQDGIGAYSEAIKGLELEHLRELLKNGHVEVDMGNEQVLRISFPGAPKDKS